MITIAVSSVDDFLNKIIKNGERAKTAKMPIPKIGYFAYCEDTEGNVFGVLQPDMEAK